jgi:class 3 adenylate cyclase
MRTFCRYHSLEDFLISSELTVDGQLDDGAGAMFPIKGREIEATVLFADISGFSRRTLELSAAETLIFVNNFFTWISAEALRNRNGVIDKYIGDEIMVVFSKEFGSADPFVDAVQAARWMGDHDALSFSPHIGLAGGTVIVGHVGTPLRFSCSVFGSPVTVAARCAQVKPEVSGDEVVSGAIVSPAAEWGDRRFDDVFAPETFVGAQAPCFRYAPAGRLGAWSNIGSGTTTGGGSMEPPGKELGAGGGRRRLIDVRSGT